MTQRALGVATSAIDNAQLVVECVASDYVGLGDHLKRLLIQSRRFGEMVSKLLLRAFGSERIKEPFESERSKLSESLASTDQVVGRPQIEAFPIPSFSFVKIAQADDFHVCPSEIEATSRLNGSIPD